MPKDRSLASPGEFLSQNAPLVRSLHARAKCDRWGLAEQDFAEGLRRSAEKRFGGSPCSPRELEGYLNSLHLEDLALARACNLGMEPAWEFFMAHFRQDLRGAASAMLRASGHADDARAAELADSLYAELYGVRAGQDGRRKSLFEYFHGRSKLSTWLRAVLAQKQVDLLRTASKTVPLEEDQEDEAAGATATRADSGAADPKRDMYLMRIDRALSAALAGLAPRDRMILACYYVDQLTLAEIGRILHEHESTVSRQLERARRALREIVTLALQREIPASNGRRAEPGLDAAQIELAFEYAQQDWPFDLSAALSPGATTRNEPPEK
jgi:RNA polymerase sigma-70 factor